MVTYNESSSSFFELPAGVLWKSNCGLEKYWFVHGQQLVHGRKSRTELEGRDVICNSIPLLLKQLTLWCPLGVAVRSWVWMAQLLVYNLCKLVRSYQRNCWKFVFICLSVSRFPCWLEAWVSASSAALSLLFSHCWIQSACDAILDFQLWGVKCLAMTH